MNLEHKISDWRQQMLAAGIKTPVPLEELEIHLREEIEELGEDGATFIHKVENRSNAGGPPSRNRRRIKIEK